MKIAFLILAHDYPSHLTNLVRRLSSDQQDCYIHIDAKSRIEDFLSCRQFADVTFIENRVRVNWGGFGMVQATLNLMEAAQQADDYDYFFLLSGNDYPIRSNTFLHYLIENDRRQYQYINMVKMPAPENGKPLSRIKNYHVDYNRRSQNTLQRWLCRGLEETLKYFDYAKELDFDAYGGSTWWGLNRACVDYVMDFVDRNPDFVKIFKTTAHPDEAFFQTIIANSPFKDQVKPSLTYAAWPEEEAYSPDIIKKKELIMFRDHLYVETSYGPTSPVFARKFNEVNTFLCEAIDRHLNDFGKELALFDTYHEHEKAYFFQDSVIQEQSIK